MAFLALTLAICVPLIIIVAMVWLASALAGEESGQDVTGSGYQPKHRKLFYRFRLWLTATPKKLDYRRDKRGRFRRVRRG